MLRLAKTALSLLALVAVGACTLFGEDTVPRCPDVRLLQNADRLTLFADGPGRDLTDTRFEIDFEGYASVCEYDIDDDTDSGTLEVEVQPGFVVRRGPADRARTVDIPFFVVLRDAIDGTPIEKANFTSTVTFEGNQRQIGLIDEPVNLNIPILPGRSGADFTILMGLQLTKEQLEFNRATSGQ